MVQAPNYCCCSVFIFEGEKNKLNSSSDKVFRKNVWDIELLFNEYTKEFKYGSESLEDNSHSG